MTSKGSKAFYILSFSLIPLLFILTVITYKVDKRFYIELTQEDHLLEWLTFVLLFLAGILSLVKAYRVRGQSNPYFIFFIIFGVLCILFALEEISWGQRILNLRSPNFFRKHSDQREINLHNVIQEIFQVKTKHIAGYVLFIYGVIFPLISIGQRGRRLFSKIGLVVPPPALAFSFFLASILMFDRPTGWEEEIGEFFFSVCFFLFMILEVSAIKNQNKSAIRPI